MVRKVTTKEKISEKSIMSQNQDNHVEWRE
jgi:hypothetical protein